MKTLSLLERLGLEIIAQIIALIEIEEHDVK